VGVVREVSVTAASSTRQVSLSTEEQLASMEEISLSVTDLAKMAEELKMNIGKFKL
jgi:methyl-accepting chemotaxis protein